VNPDLQNLLALQNLEQKIAELQKEITSVPQRIESYREEINRLNQTHQQMVDHYEELAKQRRGREGDVEMMTTKLSRLKEQLMAVKTNKEYTAMLHEIENAQAQIRKAEDEILEFMEEMENLETDLSVSEKEVKSKTKQLEESIGKAEQSVPRLEQEIVRMGEEKAATESLLHADLLSKYRRTAEVGKGIALAEAKDELCAMCHVRIRPQVYADLLKTDTIRFCDSCSRILYLRETS
jgi:predicted  nucleic acid-binding Zn-ribbon protein